LHVSIEEYIGALHISMQDLAVMKSFEASDYLNKDVPNLLLFDVSFSLLVTANLLEDISIVSILHHQTKLYFLLLN
tara:strand:+ start:1551 stop:1778 length:228 start_codon:yes stop_codon:yes gene_type:complete